MKKMFRCEYCKELFRGIDECVKHENKCSYKPKKENFKYENDPWGMCIYDDEYKHHSNEHWLDDEYYHH